MKSEVVTVVVEPEMGAVIWIIIAVIIRVVILVFISGSPIFRPEVMFFCTDQGITVRIIVNPLYKFSIYSSKDR